jgi:hypothetical protein
MSTRSHTARGRAEAVARRRGARSRVSGGIEGSDPCACPIPSIDLTGDDHIEASSPVSLRAIGRTVAAVSGAALNCFWLATAVSSGHDRVTLQKDAGTVAKEALPAIVDRLRPECVEHSTMIRDSRMSSTEWAQLLAADVAASGTMCGPIEAHCVATHLHPRRLIVCMGGQLRRYPPLRQAVDDDGRLRVDAVAAADIVATDVIIGHDGLHYNGTRLL